MVSRHTDNGDRESEAVFIGVNLDKSKMLAELQAALLTETELEGGSEAWRDFEDPFFGSEYFELNAEEGEDESIDDGEEEEAKRKMSVKKRKAEQATKAAKKARKEDEKKKAKGSQKASKQAPLEAREKDAHLKCKSKSHKIARSVKGFKMTRTHTKSKGNDHKIAHTKSKGNDHKTTKSTKAD